MKSSLTDRVVGGKAATGPIPWQVSIQKAGEFFEKEEKTDKMKMIITKYFGCF